MRQDGDGDMLQRLSEYDISNQYKAKVIETERITPADSDVEVRHMVLEVADNSFKFTEGQNIGLLAPGSKDLGNKHHFRLYSIASSSDGEGGNRRRFALTVRRCFYIDDFSGEKVKGVASNYLCDLKPGDEITFAGPYGGAFALPEDPNLNLLMIGMGTGIAPFRAFMKHIYREKGSWKGKVRLFFGAKRGIELLYMNDIKDDFTNYYDEETFQAFQALSPRPALDAPVALDRALEENGAEIWSMIQDPLTNVYVAGLQTAEDRLEEAMAKIAGSAEIWRRTKQDLKSKNRWFELIY
jgi:ferredoxin--NADP+ reductase